MKGLTMLLSRLWRWRVGLAAGLVALIAIALAASFVRERSLEPLILRAMDHAPRIAAGLSLAHERLTLSALEVLAGAAKRSRLADDLSAFHEAIARLEREDERALFNDLPGFAATIDQLRTFRAETQALEVALRLGEEGASPEVLSALVAQLAPLRDPVSDLVDSAVAWQRLEIVQRTRALRQADRMVIACLALAGLLGGLLLLVLRAGPGVGHAGAAAAVGQPSAGGIDPLLVAQAGRDLAASLHRTLGRLGLLVGADGAAAEPLRASRESAETALATAELLAEAALLQSGECAVQQIPFDPHRLLRQALSERGAPLVPVHREEGMPRLWRGDPARLAALVRALLRASALAGSAPQRVLLAAEPDGLAVTIGEGGKALFEPLDPGEVVPGAGAAALMVHALGGRLLRVRPTAGRAEQIKLLLPFFPAEGEEDVSSARSGLRVLAVDDVPANRELLAVLLERHGHCCETAADAETALARLAGGGIDVVLMDVHMPGVDGVAAVRLIRSLPPPAGRVPIVAVTAQSAAWERDSLLAAGMADVIEKPISTAELLAALSRVAGGEATAVQRSPAPVIDHVAVALLRSTLSVEGFESVVAEADAEAEAALTEAEAAAATQDLARLDAALGRLSAALEPFGAARLAEAVASVRRGDQDLAVLRRVVMETLRALGRCRSVPAAGALAART